MPGSYEYDVFISHAVEDKAAIANDLCERLRKEGLNIWYSGEALTPGVSIHDAVLTGLDKSRFGVVILSRHYISKDWTMQEYHHLEARERKGKSTVILPVHFEITIEELARKNLQMANRFAVSADKGLEHTVEKLLIEIKKIEEPSWMRILKYSLACILATAFIAGFWFFFRENKDSVDPLVSGPVVDFPISIIEGSIGKRQEMLIVDFRTNARRTAIAQADARNITRLYQNYQDLKMHFRNEYEFYNGVKRIRAKKNVNAELEIQAELLNPGNLYRFEDPEIFVRDIQSPAQETEFLLFNNKDVTFTILHQRRLNDSTYQADIGFNENIRLIRVSLWIDQKSGIKHHKMLLYGFLPTESLRFVNRKGQWVAVR